MRLLRTCLTGLLGLVLQAAGTITATPSVPLPGQPVTFVLSAGPEAIAEVRWDFGDGSSKVGGAITTNQFSSPGSYLVRVQYRTLQGGAVSLPQVAQAQVRVADHPAAPFSIALLRLRWEDGGTDRSLTQGAPLVAYVDLKCEGTGTLLAQWLVDGIPVGTFTRQVVFAETLTVDSGSLPSLPTMELGEHRVSMRFLQPQTGFQVPVIRYFVRLGRAEAPRVEGLAPARLRAGEVRELQISGRHFTKDMRLSFGKDVAVLGTPRLLSPERVLVRVYLAPTARPTLRPVVAANEYGRSRGPAGLRVEAAAPR